MLAQAHSARGTGHDCDHVIGTAGADRPRPLIRNGANFNRLMAIYESVVKRPIRAFVVVSSA
ncbi:hypothetical protein BQ8794_130037 [Mesorhizobium prunaredense]|uniref:Uncharacterized protein n=1 Tax=Mesorhizobium prunaredense TaxID=1631249 RepID=A0A1R3V0Z0_9HYPH|nr:hypothetical protein BQ8794_130037 [Mesorhizobium prunaredense]